LDDSVGFVASVGFVVGVVVGFAVGLGVLVAEPEPEPLPESVAAVVVVADVSSGLIMTSPSSVETVGSVSDSVVVATVVVSEVVVVVSVGSRSSGLLQPRKTSAITTMRIRAPAIAERRIVNCFLFMMK
jgi:hypothetical protein